MVNRSIPGQLDLFQVEDFNTAQVASGMSCESPVSTRTKVRPRSISKGQIENAAVKLASLSDLNSAPTWTTDLETRIAQANELRKAHYINLGAS